MSATPATSAPVPANEFERFLATLSEPLREQCKARLSGSGLSPDHPVFAVLADFYEKNPPRKEAAPDFYEEALLHSHQAKQLLAELRDLPATILARFEPQLHGLLDAFTAPVEKLESTSNDLARNVEALPVLLLSKRPGSIPPPEGLWRKLKWHVERLPETARTIFTDHVAWLVSGGVCALVSMIITVAVLSVGASHLSRAYEESYQQRLSHLEADSIENTIALNRLLTAGIALKVERSKDADAYYLILQGARKAAQPINSPEGLAVEVWP
jgi:hypothetical protein